MHYETDLDQLLVYCETFSFYRNSWTNTLPPDNDFDFRKNIDSFPALVICCYLQGNYSQILRSKVLKRKNSAILLENNKNKQQTILSFLYSIQMEQSNGIKWYSYQMSNKMKLTRVEIPTFSFIQSQYAVTTRNRSPELLVDEQELLRKKKNLERISIKNLVNHE